jgi:hypothetical protein
VLERQKLTPPQLAKLWGCSVQKIIWFIRSGELRAITLATSRSGRPRYAIDLDDIAAFERARQVVPDGGETTARERRAKSLGNVTQFF